MMTWVFQALSLPVGLYESRSPTPLSGCIVRVAVHPRAQSVEFISCPLGAQQQTCRTLLLWSTDGTDGRTAGRYIDPALRSTRTLSIIWPRHLIRWFTLIAYTAKCIPYVIGFVTEETSDSSSARLASFDDVIAWTERMSLASGTSMSEAFTACLNSIHATSH